MPDNVYFREPITQTVLLDILFIFCKLNADIGYRQGMHEVLAPILWVVSGDAIDPATLDEQPGTSHDADRLVQEAFDSRYVEHDAFTLFCILMQAAKSFYEMGTNSHQIGIPASSNSPIVERSKRIHEEYLQKVDPELTQHLTSIEILPQIFVIRWIRLLFGREFPFDDVLCLWDVLFAEDPALDLVDFVCLAMLLRVRWQLLVADYSSALTLLLRYPVPPSPDGPSTFVDDAIYLRNNLSTEGGSVIVSKYSGRLPVDHLAGSAGSQRRKRTSHIIAASQAGLERPNTPMRSPMRYLQQQGGIEAILQDAAKGVYSRSEKWGVGKALAGAVQGLQSGSSSPRRLPMAGVRWSTDDEKSITMISNEQLTSRIDTLEQRNKALAKMLENSIEDLYVQEKVFEKEEQESAANTLSLAIAKIQFVQVYLEDASMPLVSEEPSQEAKQPGAIASETVAGIEDQAMPTAQRPHSLATVSTEKNDDQPESSQESTTKKEESGNAGAVSDTPTKTDTSKPTEVLPDSNLAKSRPGPSPFHHPRPSLAQSSFSWMLGEDQRKSSFVSASPFAPEQKRKNPARVKAGFLFGDDKVESQKAKHPNGKKGKEKEKQNDEDGGFTLGTLKGIPSEN